ncbi:MAG TPA: hypothetical protein VIL85_02920 [Thermomicrobiales bacterium]|jgi:hypothetical protein
MDRRVGRPTRLNEEIVKRLLEMFSLGASQADACRYAGVSHDSLQRWIAAGRAELAAIEGMAEGEHDCSDAAVLVLAIDRAMGEFAKTQLANIKLAATSPNNWTASAWLLERRLPDDWGKREKVDHTHILLGEVERVAQERGLDAEATEKLKDFVREREKRRSA